MNSVSSLRHPALAVAALAVTTVSLSALISYSTVETSPLLLLGVLAALTSLLLYVVVGKRLRTLFLRSLIVLLIGYAFFSRGFAHIGLDFLFIGEVVLFLGILAVLRLGMKSLHRGQIFILLFVGYGAIRTVPYLSEYGVDAVRDASLWGYALFAILVGRFVSETIDSQRLMGFVRVLIPAFLLWIPISAFIATVSQIDTRIIPGSNVALVTYKGGDMGVHLASIMALLISGLYFTKTSKNTAHEIAVWFLWWSAFLVVASSNRGGLSAVVASIGVIIVLHYRLRLMIPVTVAIFLLSSAVILNPAIERENARDISVQQIVANAISVFGDSGDSGLEGTKNWRIEWWSDIVDYTIRGPYFWSGRGFGINLAAEDGFGAPGGSLRSPHNGHMTVLARMGVPGLTLWIALHSVFALSMVATYRRARDCGEAVLADMSRWILVFWAAAMINGTFDVYLEGPQGAIWLWSMMGLGFAVMRIETTRRLVSLDAGEMTGSQQDISDRRITDAGGRSTPHPPSG